jgi:hypothetical protein
MKNNLTRKIGALIKQYIDNGKINPDLFGIEENQLKRYLCGLSAIPVSFIASIMEQGNQQFIIDLFDIFDKNN